LHTGVFLYGIDIFTPQNMMLNKINCDWLLYMSVRRPLGWYSANESCNGWYLYWYWQLYWVLYVLLFA